MSNAAKLAKAVEKIKTATEFLKNQTEVVTGFQARMTALRAAPLDPKAVALGIGKEAQEKATASATKKLSGSKFAPPSFGNINAPISIPLEINIPEKDDLKNLV